MTGCLKCVPLFALPGEFEESRRTGENGTAETAACWKGDLPMKEVPIWEKSNLSLEEAAAYSGIGINKLRELTSDKNCHFVLWVGNKRLIKRRLFDQYIEQEYSI